MELVILKCSSWSWQLYYIMSVLALNKKNQKFNLYIILTQISEDDEWLEIVSSFLFTAVLGQLDEYAV